MGSNEALIGLMAARVIAAEEKRSEEKFLLVAVAERKESEVIAFQIQVMVLLSVRTVYMGR